MLVSRARFEELVADALDALPPDLGEQLDNVAVLVEDWPDPDALPGGEGGAQLLGLYEGIAITQRSPLSYDMVLPDRITIFRGPLCRLARDEGDLAEQVRITVLHEVGHYFGLDDDRLRELGWS